MAGSQADGIAELLAALKAEADQEIAQRDAEARQEAQAILEAARADALRLERDPVEAQEPRLRAEAQRRLAEARLDAERRFRQAREESFQEILDALRARLADLRNEGAYPQVFASLLVEACRALPSGRRVLVDPRDEALARRTASELGLDLTIEPALETWGGVVLDGGEGRTARNTLEERLANAESALRLVLAKLADSLR